ncbi:MAG TPA: hypothetical protein VGA03_11895 [Anaerolineales bacterium]
MDTGIAGGPLHRNEPGPERERVLQASSRWVARSGKTTLALLAYYAAASVLMTWPLATRLRTAVPGMHGGDNWYYVWLIGWFQKALFELGRSPLFVPLHNYPHGWSLAYTEITLSNVALALPFSLLGGPVLAYNLACLLSFILSGLVVHAWVTSITRNFAAGLVSGTLFAFAPYRLAHLYGHFPLMGTQYLALHFAGLYFLLQERELKWKYAALAGIGLGLAALSSMYYLYMTVIVSVLFTSGYLLFAERRAVLRPAFWKNLLASGLIALPFLLAAVEPYLRLSLQGSANHREFEDVDLWSASLPDFILPSPVHFIWGDWINAHFDRLLWIEKNLYIGAAAFFLIFFAFFYKRRTGEASRMVPILGFGLVCSVVLAMGTTLHWFSEQLSVAVPAFMQPFFPGDRMPIYLPNYFLYKYLPFYDGMRALSRYGIYASLFAAVLAGIGLDRLQRAVDRRWLAMAIPVLALVVTGIDFNINPFPLTEVKVRPVDEWLAAQPGNGAFVQFPIDQSTRPDLIYATLAHDRPFIGMFYGAYLPLEFERLFKRLHNFPNRGTLDALRDRGVEFVLVDASAYPNWPEIHLKILSFDLVEVAVLGEQHVFRFAP